MATSRRYGSLVAAGVGFAVFVCGREGMEAQVDTATLLRVRIFDTGVQRAVAEGRRRSQTFRNLIDAIEQSRAFVYIVKVPYLPGKMEGCVVVNVGGAGEDRYLRMMIRSGLHINRMIAVIGHESQHVLEILEKQATESPHHLLDAPGVSQLTSHQYETQAAIDVGMRIAAELREQNHGPRN